MAFPAIRELVDLLDESDNLQEVLDAAHNLRDSVEGNLSPYGNIVRLYCTIVTALCDIHLAGPSRQLANSLNGASNNALVESNRRLSTLALWYSACCRMMYLFPTATNGHLFDKQEASRMSAELHRLLAAPQRQQDPNLAAAAATMIVEYAIHARLSAETVRDLIVQAQAFLADADPSDPRVILRMAYMSSINLESPAQGRNYTELLYMPGELAATIR